MTMHRGSAVSLVLALVLGTNIFGAPTGEEPQKTSGLLKTSRFLPLVPQSPTLRPKRRSTPKPGIEAQMALVTRRSAAPTQNPTLRHGIAHPVEWATGVGCSRVSTFEIRDALGSEPEFGPAQDKPLLVPRTPVANAEAEAEADANADAYDPNCPEKRDADPDAAWSHPSCRVGHWKRMLKRYAGADPSLDDQMESVHGGTGDIIDHQLLARTPPSNAHHPARKSRGRRSSRGQGAYNRWEA
ncbi:hypothetical protein JOL62DRAFT_642527 [Phyllosticta paracitricarpa]|uniref:Uncharacterized protein n=2 Tax=Phyllosticta TaxID=121621 RepID=A0ABR1MTI7_9PEZI